MIRLLAYRSSNIIDLTGMWLLGFCGASGNIVAGIVIIAIGLPASLIVEAIDRRRQS